MITVSVPQKSQGQSAKGGRAMHRRRCDRGTGAEEEKEKRLLLVQVGQLQKARSAQAGFARERNSLGHERTRHLRGAKGIPCARLAPEEWEDLTVGNEPDLQPLSGGRMRIS